MSNIGPVHFMPGLVAELGTTSAWQLPEAILSEGMRWLQASYATFSSHGDHLRQRNVSLAKRPTTDRFES